MNFRTRVDLTNRQVKQYEKTDINLSGSTTFGLPYSALTSGIDTNSSGISETYTSILSTFSGNTGSTIFTWYDSRMSLAESYLSAITPSNSATTQETGNVFIVDSSTVIDGNTVNLTYSGVNFDIIGVGMFDLGGGDYSGSVTTSELNILTANTLDFKGRTIWADVSGITRTDRLIVTNNPTVGYVLTCADSEGMVSWSASSGSTGSTSYWSASTGSDSIVKINSNCLAAGSGSTVGSWNSSSYSNYSAIIGGFGHSITTGADVCSIFGGGESTINSGVDYSSCVGGRGNTVSNSYSGIFVGQNNTLSGGSDSWSAIIGGNNNTLVASYSVIIGGNGISGGSDNMVYVPDLVIDGLTSVTDLQTDSTGQVIDGASDITLKTNIKPLSNSLNKILQLNPISFEWVPEMNLREGMVFGLIAQEVNEVIPEIVRERAKGNGTLTLEYKELIPWLIGAIQELSSGVTTTNNTHLETQTIASEDNNIELNYNGNHSTSIGGGIVLLNGVKDGVNSEIKTDENGRWLITPSIKTNQLSLPKYTPKSTNDEIGETGDTVWDDNYIYIKRNNGWGRTKLEDF